MHTTEELQGMRQPSLIGVAKKVGLTFPRTAKKPDLIEAILGAQKDSNSNGKVPEVAFSATETPEPVVKATKSTRTMRAPLKRTERAEVKAPGTRAPRQRGGLVSLPEVKKTGCVRDDCPNVGAVQVIGKPWITLCAGDGESFERGQRGVTEGKLELEPIKG